MAWPKILICTNWLHNLSVASPCFCVPVYAEAISRAQHMSLLVLVQWDEWENTKISGNKATSVLPQCQNKRLTAAILEKNLWFRSQDWIFVVSYICNSGATISMLCYEIIWAAVVYFSGLILLKVTHREARKILLFKAWNWKAWEELWW